MALPFGYVRSRIGLSIHVVAREVGVSRETVARFERFPRSVGEARRALLLAFYADLEETHRKAQERRSMFRSTDRDAAGAPSRKVLEGAPTVERCSAEPGCSPSNAAASGAEESRPPRREKSSR